MCKCYIDGSTCNGEYSYCENCVLNPNDNDDNENDLEESENA